MLQIGFVLGLMKRLTPDDKPYLQQILTTLVSLLDPAKRGQFDPYLKRT